MRERERERAELCIAATVSNQWNATKAIYLNDMFLLSSKSQVKDGTGHTTVET